MEHLFIKNAKYIEKYILILREKLKFKKRKKKRIFESANGIMTSVGIKYADKMSQNRSTEYVHSMILFMLFYEALLPVWKLLVDVEGTKEISHFEERILGVLTRNNNYDKIDYNTDPGFLYWQEIRDGLHKLKKGEEFRLVHDESGKIRSSLLEVYKSIEKSEAEIVNLTERLIGVVYSLERHGYFYQGKEGKTYFDYVLSGKFEDAKSEYAKLHGEPKTLLEKEQYKMRSTYSENFSRVLSGKKAKPRAAAAAAASSSKRTFGTTTIEDEDDADSMVEERKKRKKTVARKKKPIVVPADQPNLFKFLGTSKEKEKEKRHGSDTVLNTESSQSFANVFGAPLNDEIQKAFEQLVHSDLPYMPLPNLGSASTTSATRKSPATPDIANIPENPALFMPLDVDTSPLIKSPQLVQQLPTPNCSPLPDLGVLEKNFESYVESKESQARHAILRDDTIEQSEAVLKVASAIGQATNLENKGLAAQNAAALRSETAQQEQLMMQMLAQAQAQAQRFQPQFEAYFEQIRNEMKQYEVNMWLRNFALDLVLQNWPYGSDDTFERFADLRTSAMAKTDVPEQWIRDVLSIPVKSLVVGYNNSKIAHEVCEITNPKDTAFFFVDEEGLSESEKKRMIGDDLFDWLRNEFDLDGFKVEFTKSKKVYGRNYSERGMMKVFMFAMKGDPSKKITLSNPVGNDVPHLNLYMQLMVNTGAISAFSTELNKRNDELGIPKRVLLPEKKEAIYTEHVKGLIQRGYGLKHSQEQEETHKAQVSTASRKEEEEEEEGKDTHSETATSTDTVAKGDDSSFLNQFPVLNCLVEDSEDAREIAPYMAVPIQVDREVPVLVPNLEFYGSQSCERQSLLEKEK